MRLSQGWALGTKEFKAALMKDFALAADARAWESSGAREIRQERWTRALSRCLKRLGKSETDAQNDRKGAAWKAAVALRLKEITQAGNRWLTEQLRMGRPEAVSVHVGRLRGNGATKNSDYNRLTTIVST